MLVTKEEGAYIIRALAKILLVFALLSYVVINEHRHKEILKVERQETELLILHRKWIQAVDKDVRVLKGIHIYEFEKAYEQARSTLP